MNANRLSLVAGVILASCVQAPAVALAGDVSFGREVRPILAENCFACHGQDAGRRQADLRLDVRDGAIAPAKGRVIAIVPGKADKSELIRRITSTDVQERMPHAKSNKKPLSAERIQVLKRWINEGANYESHWAFTAPVRPALPDVKDATNSVDRFVIAKLAREGMAPSKQADKITLLRRLSLDLIGLPPTIAEVDAFWKDESPDAYARQVERLLASPHYGEVWGRHWLDAAHYADSDGFEKDKPRFIYFYRDWVIGAFNRDLPYDQFVIEQLAGDQLAHPTQDQIAATGFLRNALLNEEGGVDPEQFRMDEMFDRMDAIGKSILGLTIQCAQCHSHKYDPLTQAEYYRMFAFLNNDHEAAAVMYTPGEQMLVANLRQGIREIENDLQRQTPDWRQRMAAWEQSLAEQPRWSVLELANAGDNGERFIPQKDGSYLAQGYAPTKFTAQFNAKPNLKHITAFRLEYLTDPNLPCGGPGRSIWGTCGLSEFSVDLIAPGDAEKKTKVKIVDASADFEQTEADLESPFYDKTTTKRTVGPVKFAIDGNANSAWGINAGPGRRNQDRKAVFNLDKPIDVEGNEVVRISLKQNHGGWNSDDNQTNNLGRFRVSVTTVDGAVKADPLPARVRKILTIDRDRRTPGQEFEVFGYWRTTVPEWKNANQKIESLWKQWPAGVTSLTLAARAEPRETHVLGRGDWLKPTERVAAGVPAFLHQLPEHFEPTRLTFARWLVDRKSPTTARAFVNRVWQAYFGIGIVATAEDLGTQAELPSHPELLDWLACEFMEPTVNAAGENSLAPGWSIKHLHRLIVSSATYQQSSRQTPEMVARDPYNRLLARASRFRVDGEIVHDIALSASGLLNEEIGGRSVMPPAPAFIFQPPASYAPFPWIEENGPEKYRRAVYTFRRRSTPFPVLQIFDVPNGESSCVRRSRSNSPVQALAALNEPMAVECAQSLARKTLESGLTTNDTRLIFAFRRVLARTPTEAERNELLSLLEKEQKRFADGWLNPNEIAAGKSQPSNDLPPGATPTQLAAWTVVSRVLLNLDETITRE